MNSRSMKTACFLILLTLLRETEQNDERITKITENVNLFRDIGIARNGVRYAHISAQLSTNEIITKYGKIIDLISLIKDYADKEELYLYHNKTEIAKSYKTLFPTEYNFKVLNQRLEQIEDKIMATCYVVGCSLVHPYEAPTSSMFAPHKRSAFGILLGGVAISMAGFNWVQINKIWHDLEKDEKFLKYVGTKLVQQSETLNNLTTDVSYIKRALENQLKFDMELMKREQLDFAVANLDAEILNFLAEVNDWEETAINVAKGIVSTKLFSADSLWQTYLEIKKQARKRRMKLLRDNPAALYTSKISSFHHGGSLKVVIHVPLVYNEVRLYVREKLPTFLDKHSPPVLIDEEGILGINWEGPQMTVFSPLDLSLCEHTEGEYICIKKTSWQPPEHICLASLFLGGKVAERCKFRTVGKTEVLTGMLSNHSLGIYSEQPLTLEERCEKRVEKFTLKGFNQIRLTPNCRVVADGLDLEDHEDIRLRQRVRGPKLTGLLPDLLREYDWANWTSMWETVEEIKIPHPVDLKELRDRVAKYDEQKAASNLKTNIALASITLILVIAAGIIVWCWRLNVEKNRERLEQLPQVAYQPAEDAVRVSGAHYQEPGPPFQSPYQPPTLESRQPHTGLAARTFKGFPLYMRDVDLGNDAPGSLRRHSIGGTEAEPEEVRAQLKKKHLKSVAEARDLAAVPTTEDDEELRRLKEMIRKL